MDPRAPFRGSLPLDYPSETIVSLDSAPFEAFERTGRGWLPHPEFPEQPMPAAGRLCLVMPEDRFSDLIVEAAPLEALMGATRFGQVDDDGKQLVLLPEPASVAAFIEERKAEGLTQLPLLDLEPVRKFAYLQLTDSRQTYVWEHAPPPEVPLRLPIFIGVLNSALSGEPYAGQISTCTCNEPGCGAEYAWFERRICLFLLEADAGGPRHVRLFPFRLPG